MEVTCKLGEKGCWNDGKCRATSNCENKVITNADRIRAMSDEELAKHFSGLICDINEGVEYHEAPSRWLEWLKQPADMRGEEDG